MNEVKIPCAGHSDDELSVLNDVDGDLRVYITYMGDTESFILIHEDDAMQWAWKVFCLACQANGVEVEDAVPVHRAVYHNTVLGSQITVRWNPRLGAHTSRSARAVQVDLTTDPTDAPEDCKRSTPCTEQGL